MCSAPPSPHSFWISIYHLPTTFYICYPYVDSWPFLHPLFFVDTPNFLQKVLIRARPFLLTSSVFSWGTMFDHAGLLWNSWVTLTTEAFQTMMEMWNKDTIDRGQECGQLPPQNEKPQNHFCRIIYKRSVVCTSLHLAQCSEVGVLRFSFIQMDHHKARAQVSVSASLWQ